MTALPQGLSAGTWNVDANHSEFAFTARHAGVSKVRGKFSVIGGTVEFGDDFESLKVEATADASTIDTNNADRDGHLKSNDFFLAEEHPQITFKSVKVHDFDGSEFKLEGELTIRGVSQTVTFDAEFNGANEDPYGNKVAGFSAVGKVSRKAFGMEFNATIPGGDLLVSDKITIDVELELTKA